MRENECRPEFNARRRRLGATGAVYSYNNRPNNQEEEGEKEGKEEK